MQPANNYGIRVVNPLLAKAYKILKDAELGLKGEPFRITGLLGYLLEMEREETDQHASPAETFSG